MVALRRLALAANIELENKWLDRSGVSRKKMEVGMCWGFGFILIFLRHVACYHHCCCVPSFQTPKRAPTWGGWKLRIWTSNCLYLTTKFGIFEPSWSSRGLNITWMWLENVETRIGWFLLAETWGTLQQHVGVRSPCEKDHRRVSRAIQTTEHYTIINETAGWKAI